MKEAECNDGNDSPYKAIVSHGVKEGWDVRNVTTIVGLGPTRLRARYYQSKHLVEAYENDLQFTHNRVCQCHWDGGIHGFRGVNQEEGIELERKPMGDPTERTNIHYH